MHIDKRDNKSLTPKCWLWDVLFCSMYLYADVIKYLTDSMHYFTSQINVVAPPRLYVELCTISLFRWGRWGSTTHVVIVLFFVWYVALIGKWERIHTPRLWWIDTCDEWRYNGSRWGFVLSPIRRKHRSTTSKWSAFFKLMKMLHIFFTVEIQMVLYRNGLSYIYTYIWNMDLISLFTWYWHIVNVVNLP